MRAGMKQAIVIDIDGITGDCQLDGYEAWHYVDEVRFGATQTGAAQNVRGANRSRVQVSDVTVSKLVDAATPSLFAALFNNRLHSKVNIVMLEATGDEHKAYLEVNLRDVIVKDLQLSGLSAELMARNVATLSYRKIELVYHAKDISGDRSGAASTEFDVGQNQIR